MSKNWDLTKNDKNIISSLEQMIPERIFDAHAHIYRKKDLNISSASPVWSECPDTVGIVQWKEEIQKLFPKSIIEGGLFLSTPSPACDIQSMNNFLFDELKRHSVNRGLIQFSMDASTADYEKMVQYDGVVGFKPYHFSCNNIPSSDADINEFLPIWVWELADKYKLVITLHMVKDGALNDKKNQEIIVNMCRAYPGARLILAHAGRGFHALNTVKGIQALRGLDNVWFDLSGICESEPLLSILHEFGPSRLLWGSDFPISHLRGKAVTLGTGFAWLQSDTVDWSNPSLGGHPEPVFVALESLRALKFASDEYGLNDRDMSDIFCDNALKLLKIKKETGTLTQDSYLYAKTRIPGGTQLLSKRPENMAPGQWPAYFTEAKGCEVRDLDGNRFIDMYSNGIGSCLLGYRDPDVDRAVRRRINMGSQSTLNPYDEVKLADKLCEIHPWASQVRFVRTGGEAVSVAVRIARAKTDRSIIAVCGYHGWHDWYLAANLGESDSLRGHLLPGLSPIGVPRELRGTTLAFTYNNREELSAIIEKHGDELAAVVMEPCRYQDPEDNFLEFVQESVHKCGALLIFDEITIGWRLHFGGAHLKLGVIPDIAVFAKALGNGYPIGAIIGNDSAMEGAHISFISSTYWTEGIGPAAGLAVLEKMEKVDAPSYVANAGNRVLLSWKKFSTKHNLPIVFDGGYPCLAHFRFDHPESENLRTLYTQLMLEKGFLAAGSIYPTMAHTDDIIDQYAEAIDSVFYELSIILEKGLIENSLKGPVAMSGFKRLIQ